MTEAVSAAAVQTTPAVEVELSEQIWKQAEALTRRIPAGWKAPALPARDLFRLKAGAVMVTECARSTGVRPFANRELIGLAKFRTVGDGLAATLTELAR